MANCPYCKAELSDEATSCWRCGKDIDNDDDQIESKWVMVGVIEDKLSADFARETLTVYQIPAVIASRSGYFGDIGLPLNPFYRPKATGYEVSVPEEFVEEAADLLAATLGDKWQREE